MAVGGREEKWMVLDHSTNPVAASTSRCEPFPGVCQKSDMIVFFYGGVEAVFKSFIANFVAIFVEPN
jgi:hypothetical protein